MSTLHATEAFVRRDFKVSSRVHSSALLPARIALVATLFAAPWAFGAVDAWAWMSLGLAACLALLLWVAGAVRQKMLRLVWSPLYIPLAAFFLLALAQYFTGRTLDRTETRQALVLFAVDATFFFIAVQLFSETGSHTRRRFGLAVLLSAGILGLFAIVQFASGAQRIYWIFDTPGTFFGPYSNPDHYAGLMEMLVPVAVCYVASQRQKYSVVILLLLSSAAAVATTSLLLTGSRGGLLALFTEIAIAGVMFRRKAQGANRWSLAAALAGAVLAVVLLFSWIDPGWVAPRLGTIVDVPGQMWIDATEFRKRVALDSLHMLRDHPAFGVGLGNFEIAYPPYQTFPSDLSVDYAHDDYIQAAAETGLVGTVLIVSALALFFHLAFHSPHRLESSHGWIQLGAALGCCGLLVHSFVDFNLHIPANAAWFAVLSGIATTRNHAAWAVER